MSENDQKVLKKVRSKAYQLDLVFQCCCGCQLGWAGIIGLIPWIGDVICLFLALSIVKKARQIDGGLPKYIEAQMMANVTFDFCIGLIPIVGDLCDIAYKANSRNYVLLENYLVKNSKPSHSWMFGSNNEKPVASKTDSHKEPPPPSRTTSKQTDIPTLPPRTYSSNAHR